MSLIRATNPIIRSMLSTYRANMDTAEYERFLTDMVYKLIDDQMQAPPPHVDNSQFPFDEYSTDELGALFFLAIKTGDYQHADAIRGQIRQRKAGAVVFETGTNMASLSWGYDDANKGQK